MDWRIIVGVAGFLAAFLLGLVVDSVVEQSHELCDVRERLSCVECQCPSSSPGAAPGKAIPEPRRREEEGG